MTMNTQQTGGTDISSIPIGAKLQSAREAQRLERKDAAAKLRLNESVIDMIENNSFPVSMPSIFIRGYIRAYGKLLDMPDDVIVAGLEPIQPSSMAQEATSAALATTAIEPTHKRRQYLMKAATAAVVLILIGLVAAWWRSHANAPRPEIIALTVPAENTSAGDLTSLPAGLIVVPPQAHATQTVSSLLPLRAAATAAPVVTHEPEKLATIAPARPAHPEQAAAKTSADASIPAYKRAAMAQPVNNPVTEDNTEVE